MNRLSKRLKRLEGTLLEQPHRSVSAAEVDAAALSELSAADRDLVQQAMAKHSSLWLMESHPEVWSRWEVALARGFETTGFLIRFRADDWEF